MVVLSSINSEQNSESNFRSLKIKQKKSRMNKYGHYKAAHFRNMATSDKLMKPMLG